MVTKAKSLNTGDLILEDVKEIRWVNTEGLGIDSMYIGELNGRIYVPQMEYGDDNAFTMHKDGYFRYTGAEADMQSQIDADEDEPRYVWQTQMFCHKHDKLALEEGFKTKIKIGGIKHRCVKGWHFAFSYNSFCDHGFYRFK